MRNHYVPQFLQLPWTSADGKLQAFRLSDGITKRRAPKANGFRHDMLSLTRDQIMQMDKNAIERVVLMRIDHDADLVRKKLVEGSLKSLSHEERCAWVRFIMSLRLRQPKLVEELRMGAAQTLREKLAEQPEEYQSLAVDDTFPTLEAWTEAAYPGAIDSFGLSFFHEMIDNAEIGGKLLQLRWWLWRFSEQDHDLLLSDNPCIFAGGIDNPHLAVVLPLGPRIAFLATRGEMLADLLAKADSKTLSRNLNDASILQAEEYIYAVDDSQRIFILNRRSPTFVTRT